MCMLNLSVVLQRHNSKVSPMSSLLQAEDQLYKLVQDIETTRCQIEIIGKLIESRSLEFEPPSKPNMYLKYISRETFAQFMNSLSLKEVLLLVCFICS